VPYTETLAIESSCTAPAEVASWVANATLLWARRRTLARVAAVALLLSGVIAFLIPKRYDSIARIMPPDQTGSSLAMLAALTGHSLGGVGGSLAGSLLGVKSTGSLYMDLLRSRAVGDRLIDRFDLQHVYRKRYRIDTIKYLARHTTIADDKKSGVISLTYSDTDPERARTVAQAYLDELNAVITRSNISSAQREREFIEKRLVNVQADLQMAEKALSDFSSVNTTFDIKEQTHAMVEAGAKLQAEVIVNQSELDSLRQIYGEDNVRVRAARARIGDLQRELARMSGSSAALSEEGDRSSAQQSSSLYPSLRQLPRLAVPYADLYRRVRIQETVFELLSQQYEMARIEEAKDTPVVSVIDPPLVAEKKSFPPRLWVMLLLTSVTVMAASMFLILKDRWRLVDSSDPLKLLVQEMGNSLAVLLCRLSLEKGAR
jgi:capsule polysaccharide export protein KpsE/RkpR